MADRVRFDSDGIRISEPGFDVTTTDPTRFIANTDAVMPGVLQYFTIELTAGSQVRYFNYKKTFSAPPFLWMVSSLDFDTNYLTGTRSYGNSGLVAGGAFSTNPMSKVFRIGQFTQISPGAPIVFTAHDFTSETTRLKVDSNENASGTMTWITGTSWVFVLDWY